ILTMSIITTNIGWYTSGEGVRSLARAVETNKAFFIYKTLFSCLIITNKVYLCNSFLDDLKKEETTLTLK
ncbi:hypothetical protein L9F63_016871, partial [Diploptera punctata]